jgi:hypothetical protein
VLYDAVTVLVRTWVRLLLGGTKLMRVSYVRISTNEKGASCFEDCYSDLAPGYAVPPAPSLFSRDFTKAGQCFWIGAPPTWGGQVPHPVPRRQIFVTVSGEYEVSVGDGVTRRFPPGAVLVLEDTTGMGHSTRVVSAQDVFVFGVTMEE